MRGLHIRHSVIFNGYSNTTPFYPTVDGLTEEELLLSSCPSGIFTLPLPGFFHGAGQDCTNTTEGYFSIFKKYFKRWLSINQSIESHTILKDNIVTLSCEN